jgi:predicted transposase YdaD
MSEEVKQPQNSQAQDATSAGETARSEQDNAWKEILGDLFEDFLLFFFPKYHAEIDWSVKPEFLDGELQKLVADSEEIRRLADKLAKVRLKNGKDKYLLVHVEVQGYSDKDFARRMFIYYYRMFDRFKDQIASLALLTQPGSGRVPNTFKAGFLDGQLTYKFPVAKLWQMRKRAEYLRQSNNPFAFIVLAQLSAIYTKTPEEMYAAKLQILRDAVDRGFEREDVLKLMRLTDWLLRLPRELEVQLQQQLRKERSAVMPYMTSWEEIAMEKGLEQGLQRGLEQGRELGLEQGRELGLEQGRELGLEIGRQEGRQAGQQEGRRQALVEVNLLFLSEKFGEVAPEVDNIVRNLEETQLKQLSAALLHLEAEADLRQWLDRLNT